MASISSETIWSSMINARQLSITYYTLSTCLTDLLHRYVEISQTNKISSSLFHNLDQTLFSSVTPSNQSKLSDEYSNILVNILKKNTIHTNIIQNVRRLFRFDSCLKELFTTELNEYCLCHECDCTISNSITDVIHDVGEIRTTLLTESGQTSCTCFRCGDQNQTKIITFKQFSPCLALTVNRLNINATEQLLTAQGITYELSYIIEFDSASRSITNVYLRQDSEFIKVDGQDISSRSVTINGDGKFLTLWLSRPTSTSATVTSTSELITSVPHNDTFLSPPQSAASSSQIIVNNEVTISNEIQDTTDLIDVPMESNTTVISPDEDDEQFWNSLIDQTTPANSENMSTTHNDSISDVYLTLLHSTHKDPTSIKSRAEHDRTVSSLATDIFWPLIVDQTSRRNEKNTSSSSTTQSISSNSSRTSSTIQRNSSLKQTSSARTRRIHPYSKS
ncbi:unnamed protein product [Rotaria socialis]|uniref:Ubiquitin-specific peptidase-like SUMO isopeptidase domain-containing protein n=1 Tax=Rotaria socialis TaxID=392032 RepID=A0A820NNH5_9BILA|nr:unnamed protein product [Rotaria socialis]CAF3615926.1 unnamed protein product [Rotaria socialis]CAF4394624.1 unnamed protein product [Rotaria socialis]CAF4792282.1 unnamed protein product [Rotaria socialis]